LAQKEHVVLALVHTLYQAALRELLVGLVAGSTVAVETVGVLNMVVWLGWDTPMHLPQADVEEVLG
jgi:hypothetical protein